MGLGRDINKIAQNPWVMAISKGVWEQGLRNWRPGLCGGETEIIRLGNPYGRDADTQSPGLADVWVARRLKGPGQNIPDVR